MSLPDLLAPSLRLLLVGINPSVYAVARGHYFARKQNRFWPAFSASLLGQPLCRRLGVERLGPEHDALLPAYGVGLTDVVKIPSANCSGVTEAMYQEAAPRLHALIAEYNPAVVAFHGLTAFRPFARFALGLDPRHARLGEQPAGTLERPCFVVPNPSGANAHFTLADQVEWYNRLARLVAPPCSLENGSGATLGP